MTIVVDAPDGGAKVSPKSPLFFAHAEFSKRLHEHPRLRNWKGLDQVDKIVDLLRRDPVSRRAVVGVWDPAQDLEVENPQGVIAMIFNVRSRKLHLTTFFRTTDAWLCNWSLAAMTDLQSRVLAELVGDGDSAFENIQVGPYSQFHGSFHMYLDDVLQAARVLDVSPPA